MKSIRLVSLGLPLCWRLALWEAARAPVTAT